MGELLLGLIACFVLTPVYLLIGLAHIVLKLIWRRKWH